MENKLEETWEIVKHSRKGKSKISKKKSGVRSSSSATTEEIIPSNRYEAELHFALIMSKRKPINIYEALINESEEDTPEAHMEAPVDNSEEENLESRIGTLFDNSKVEKSEDRMKIQNDNFEEETLEICIEPLSE